MRIFTKEREMGNGKEDEHEKGTVGETPAAKLLQTLNDGLPFGRVLDGFEYEEALAILDSIMAEIKSNGVGGKGYMDAAEDKGVGVDFEKKKEGIHYPYRRPGINSVGCRVIVYEEIGLEGKLLTKFIESKVSFFEGLNESARAEFIRQNLIIFNEKQLSELLRKHDMTFERDTSELHKRLEEEYKKRHEEDK